VRRWLAAVLLVTVGWFASPGAVPVYDGVNAPDEPYKYAGRSPAPATVSTTAPISGGRSASLQLKSSENGPQVLIDLSAGAFTAARPTVTLTVTPQPPSGTPPRGSFDSNVYHVTVSPGAVLHPETAQGFLFLRAAVMTRPNPVIVHRMAAADPWVEVKTTLAGTDILSTPLRDLGDYAVARVPGSKPLSAGGLSLVRILLIGGGVLLLLTVTVLVLRRPRPDDE
jgi:hypothetical protein